MARRRFIGAGIWHNANFVACSDRARLTFLGLCTNHVVDDDGRMPGNPAEVAMLIFPGDHVPAAKMAMWLNELAEVDPPLIHHYVGPDGRLYVEIPRFREHQDSRYYVASKLPPFQQQGGIARVPADSPSRLVLSTSTSRNEKIPQPPLAGLDLGVKIPAGFEAWWQVYPRKRDKGEALKAWQQLNPDPTLQARMVAAVRRQATWPDWVKEDGKFIPYPATWIRGMRWDDEPGPGGGGPGGLSEAERRFREGK